MDLLRGAVVHLGFGGCQCAENRDRLALDLIVQRSPLDGGADFGQMALGLRSRYFDVKLCRRYSGELAAAQAQRTAAQFKCRERLVEGGKIDPEIEQRAH